MSPLAVNALQAIFRWALTLAAGYFIKAGIWDATEAESYVAAGAVALVTLGWSLWQKYHAALYQAIAQMLPHKSTLAEVKAVAASGVSLPSAFTAATVVPVSVPEPTTVSVPKEPV
jgi:hypothetical protein